eukprot:1914197-Prymnesium_polylepis.1
MPGAPQFGSGVQGHGLGVDGRRAALLGATSRRPALGSLPIRRPLPLSRDPSTSDVATVATKAAAANLPPATTTNAPPTAAA